MRTEITIDAKQVAETMKAAPTRFVSTLNDLLYDGGIDVQRDMRVRAPVHDGAYRNSIRLTSRKRAFEVEVRPHAKHAPWVEKGTRPHWVGVRHIQKWADDKGIPVYALQRSIARKGTKGQWVVEKTYNFTHRRVRSNVISGMSRFVREVNGG